MMKNVEDLLYTIENMKETEYMQRLSITKKALLYVYHDAERLKVIDYGLGAQIKTLLHIAVLDLLKEK